MLCGGAFSAALGGVATTVSADSDWQQEFFYLCNPSAEMLNVSSGSQRATLEQWAADWLRANLEFVDYLQTALGVSFCEGALNSLPAREFHSGMREAFEKAAAQDYSCDGDLIKRVNADVPLFELRAYRDGARVFFQLRDAKPYIAGFYTKGQSVCQQKAIQQAARRVQTDMRLGG